jgi:hypothetical protein
MKIIDSIITDDQIKTIKNYWENTSDNRYVNWADGNKLIDIRCDIKQTTPEFQIIKSIVAKDFPNPIRMWSAYQRQSRPHNIHIDDYGIEQEYAAYTYIIALDTVPEFKAIVWKEKSASNKEFHKYIADWGQNRKEKISNISEVEDLEHTRDENQNDYMCDYLTLDGIYTYKAGNGCLFNARQMHCTNNWLKYKQFQYRELLQIHVITKDPLFDG